MKSPLAYITASWGSDPTENAEFAAKYSRKNSKLATTPSVRC